MLSMSLLLSGFLLIFLYCQCLVCCQVFINFPALSMSSVLSVPSCSGTVSSLAFLEAWRLRGPPGVFWLGCLFSPPAFLTGLRQYFARVASLPIDTVTFQYQVRLAKLLSHSCSWCQRRFTNCLPRAELPLAW